MAYVWRKRLTSPCVSVACKEKAPSRTPSPRGQVFRIMVVLKEAAKALEQKHQSKLLGGAQPVADAYAVLGVDPLASGGEVKKRWVRVQVCHGLKAVFVLDPLRSILLLISQVAR